VEEADVKALYEERYSKQPQGGTDVHLRQILVPAGKEAGRSVEQSCALVGQLRERVVHGESFEDLAHQFSAVEPEHGGDIGWLHEDSMASWMTALIRPLEAGAVSSVVTLPVGCTIIQMAERKNYEPVTYEQAKAKLTEEAFDRKVAKEYRAWIDERRSKTYIERRGYFAEAAGFAKSGNGAAATAPEMPATP
jgi:parvulin-like peptidyl-prolyl isomerase